MVQTSITGKQYPSTSEVFSMFGQMGQQLSQRELAKQNLELRRQHEKNYGKYMAAQIKHMEQEADLLRVKNQMLFMKDWHDMQGKIGKALQDQADNQRATYLDVAENYRLTANTFINSMKPGDTEQTESVYARKMADTFLKKAQGMKDIDIAESQKGMFNPIKLPEEEATLGQKIAWALQHPETVAGDLKSDIEKALGTNVIDNIVKKLPALPDETKSLVGEYIKRHAEGKVAAEDIPKIFKLAREGNLLELTTNYPLPPDDAAKELTATEFSVLAGPEGILELGSDEEMRIDVAVRQMNAKAPPGVRFKKFDRGFIHRGGRFRVVEDIPTGLGGIWNDLTDIGKLRARTAIEKEGKKASDIIAEYNKEKAKKGGS